MKINESEFLDLVYQQEFYNTYFKISNEYVNNTNNLQTVIKYTTTD